MKRSYPVTIKDIANELKLSVSTVSRALRGSTEIKEETRLLVKEVAERLNYIPNPIALSLKEKRSKIIGVIVPEIANPFCSATIAGIEDIAYSRGYHVLIFQSHEKYQREVASTQVLASRHIDGLIISLSNETTEYGHLEAVMERNIPLVMYDRVYDGIKTHKVVTNDHQGAYNAVEHLLREGYRRVAHITLSPSLSITQNRLAGHREALQQYGLAADERLVIYSDLDIPAMERRIAGLFGQPYVPDALLIAAERLVPSCLKVLRQLQLRIPDDVGVVCFSDNPINEFIGSGLTAVRQPTFDIGQKAASMLLELIEGKPGRKAYRTVRLGTTLDVQHSSRRSGSGAGNDVGAGGQA